jgi:hypothetical protein
LVFYVYAKRYLFSSHPIVPNCLGITTAALCFSVNNIIGCCSIYLLYQCTRSSLFRAFLLLMHRGTYSACCQANYANTLGTLFRATVARTMSCVTRGLSKSSPAEKLHAERPRVFFVAWMYTRSVDFRESARVV